MKTVYILNPMSGRYAKNNDFLNRLVDTVYDSQGKIEVYTTKSVGDATDIVRNYCETKGAARFVACGGDGTLSEVVNGVMGFEGASVGAMPIGTGNDFCRNFPNAMFADSQRQQQAEFIKCDTILCRLFNGGKEKVVHCVNMANIGFDCNVVDEASKMKIKKFVPHSIVYLMTALVTLIRKKCTNLVVELDGKRKHSGELLLTTIANGSFCGGGFMSNPLASVCDGSIDVNIIKNVSRLRFLSLLPSYKKGKLFSKKGIERFAFTSKCKKLSIVSMSGVIKVCLDGEIFEADRAEIEVCPGAFNFVVPK